MGVSQELPPSRALESKGERMENFPDSSSESTSNDDCGINSNSSRRRTKCIEKKTKRWKGSQYGCSYDMGAKKRCCDTHSNVRFERRQHNKKNGNIKKICERHKGRPRSSLSSCCYILAQPCDASGQDQCKRKKRKRHTKSLQSRETNTDEEVSVSSLNSNLPSQKTSSDDDATNNIIDFRKNVQSSENATCILTSDVENTKFNQCMPETEVLNPSIELMTTPKLTVEGILQDDFKFDLPTQTSHMHIETSSPVRLETLSRSFPHSESTKNTSDSLNNMEMNQEEMFYKVATPISGSKARKKRVVHKSPFHHTLGAQNEKETCSSLLRTSQPPCWDEGILCDLCHQGTSLLLGGWYCVCCGSQVANCQCSEPNEHRDDTSSGKVHKMCALWSSETYIDRKTSIQGLMAAVKMGKFLKCVKCQKYGATIVCCISTCSQSFHYSCADFLASRLRCAMWKEEEKMILACDQHRLVARLSLKDRDALLNLKRQLKRVQIESGSSQVSHGRISYNLHPVFPQSDDLYAKNNDMLIEIRSDSEEEDKLTRNSLQTDGEGYIPYWPKQMGGFIQMDPTDPRVSGHGGTLYCIGENLLCTDISKGWEPVRIPCTNDIDSAPAPDINYINKSRCRANAKDFYKSLCLVKENISQPCKGCNYRDVDNPWKEVSSHLKLKDSQRHTDMRIDWQGQPMYGLNPYDRYGRLQVGPEIDIVECNDRCPCEAECLNKELQKGLRFHLEVYRTENQSWAVRTTEQIARGRFVIEYAGEIVTHENAHKLRGEYDLAKLSCFASKSRNLLTIDGHRMSNIARFISFSAQGNLGIHRVYTETVDPRFYRMGLYAARDIEIGEQLFCQISNPPDCRLMGVCFPPASRQSDELMYVAEMNTR